MQVWLFIRVVILPLWSYLGAFDQFAILSCGKQQTSKGLKAEIIQTRLTRQGYIQRFWSFWIELGGGPRHIAREVKALIATLLVLMAAWTPAVAGKSLERVTVSGVDYVRLRDWAAAGGFKMRARSEKLLELTSSAAKLQFNISATRAEIKGITVFLSMPILDNKGVALISLVDLQATVHPILYPTRAAPKERVRKVCLDPGHGGRDTGNIDRRHVEKKYTLLLAEEVARELKKNGLEVVFTRTKDVTLDLSDRPAIARRSGADLFLSLHYNAFTSSDVCGCEVHCMTPPGVNSTSEGGGKGARQVHSGNAQNDANVILGYLMQRELLESLGLDDRGLKRSRFAVLRDVNMPAILIEAGFMSNPPEAKKIYDPAFRKKTAQAIVNGVMAYKRTVERD